MRSRSINRVFQGLRVFAIVQRHSTEALARCQENSCDRLQKSSRRMVGSAISCVMASRRHPPVVTAFGGVLRILRERLSGSDRAHSRKAAARLINAAGATVSIDQSTLWRWEQGDTARIDPLALRALARVYRVTFQGLLAVLEANLQNPTLTEADALALLETVDALQPEPQQAPVLPDEDRLRAAAILLDTANRLADVAYT